MNTVYEVETILDEAVIDNEPHYLIKWKHLSHQHDTWEPISNLHNIADYLQHWLRKRRQHSANKLKQQNKGSFKTIKPYLYGEHLRVPRKTTRQKYAEDILKKRKTWQKYVEMEEECIQLDSSKKEEKVQKDKQSQIEPVIRIEKEIKTVQDKPLIKKQQFKVIGSIDTSQIVKIIKIFTWKETKCAQVELNDGRRFNMKEDELKKYHPLMVVEYYQHEGVAF